MLDVGCGDGEIAASLLTQLRRNVKLYVGVDVNAKALEEAGGRQLGTRQELICCDANGFQSRCKFDLIISFNSVYGLTWDGLRRVAGHCDKDGVLLIVANSDGSVLSQLSASGPWRMLTAEDVAGALSEMGLRFEDSEVKYPLDIGSAEGSVTRYLCGKAAAHIIESSRKQRMWQVDRALVVCAAGNQGVTGAGRGLGEGH